MHLSVIVRTHDKSNLHGERYTGTPKAEVTYRCLYSIIRSVNEALASGALSKDTTSITVLDDHSERPDILKKILSGAECETRFEALLGTGNNDSMLRYFELGRDASDLVYLVEDDYLHEPGALGEMILEYRTFSANRGGPVALIPFDDPDNYRPHGIVPSRIVYGRKRHWRTNDWSLCTFMLSSEVIRKHWSTFERLARMYAKGTGVTEQNTFTPLWEKEVTLFSPIPSLALHVQTEQYKDPYIFWKEWWDRADFRKARTVLQVVHTRDDLPGLLATLGLRGRGVEIGTGAGKYSQFLLTHTSLSKLYCVDSWRMFPGGEYNDLVNVSQEKYDATREKALALLAPFRERCEVLWMLSREASEKFPDSSLDFVYIDGNHSYSGCAEDIALWWPKLKKGGVFAGHDYIPDGVYKEGEFGVQKAVKEFVEREGQQIQRTEEMWPTWWCIKK